MLLVTLAGIYLHWLKCEISTSHNAQPQDASTAAQPLMLLTNFNKYMRFDGTWPILHM